MREWLEETLAKHTGQDVEKIRRDLSKGAIYHHFKSKIGRASCRERV